MQSLVILKKTKQTVQLRAAKFYNNVYLNSVRTRTIKDCNQFFKIYQKQQQKKKATSLLKLSTQLSNGTFDFTPSSSRGEPRFINTSSFVNNYNYFYSNWSDDRLQSDFLMSTLDSNILNELGTFNHRSGSLINLNYEVFLVWKNTVVGVVKVVYVDSPKPIYKTRFNSVSAWVDNVTFIMDSEGVNVGLVKVAYKPIESLLRVIHPISELIDLQMLNQNTRANYLNEFIIKNFKARKKRWFNILNQGRLFFRRKARNSLKKFIRANKFKMFTKPTKKVYLYYKKLVNNVFKKYINVNERELCGEARLTFLICEFMHKRHKVPSKIYAKIVPEKRINFNKPRKSNLPINRSGACTIEEFPLFEYSAQRFNRFSYFEIFETCDNFQVEALKLKDESAALHTLEDFYFTKYPKEVVCLGTRVLKKPENARRYRNQKSFLAMLTPEQLREFKNQYNPFADRQNPSYVCLDTRVYWFVADVLDMVPVVAKKFPKFPTKVTYKYLTTEDFLSESEDLPFNKIKINTRDEQKFYYYHFRTYEHESKKFDLVKNRKNQRIRSLIKTYINSLPLEQLLNVLSLHDDDKSHIKALKLVNSAYNPRLKKHRKTPVLDPSMPVGFSPAKFQMQDKLFRKSVPPLYRYRFEMAQVAYSNWTVANKGNWLPNLFSFCDTFNDFFYLNYSYSNDIVTNFDVLRMRKGLDSFNLSFINIITKKLFNYSNTRQSQITCLSSFLSTYSSFLTHNPLSRLTKTLFLYNHLYDKKSHLKSQQPLYKLLFKFKKAYFHITLLDSNNRIFFSLHTGLFLRYFNYKKSLKKSKSFKLLLMRYLRKLLLITGINNFNLYIRESSSNLSKLLRVLQKPLSHPFVDPFTNTTIVENSSTKNRQSAIFNFIYIIFFKTKPYGFMKTKKVGRIKRKIRRKVMKLNNILD